MIARTPVGRAVAWTLSLALSQLAVPVAQAAAAPHVVDAAQLASRLAEHAAQREARLEIVQQVLDTPSARAQARLMGVSAGRLQAAVPHLSDAELADLSQRAAFVQDVAAGHGGSDGLMIAGLVLLIAGLIVVAAVAYDDGYYYDDYCDCW